MGEAAWRIDDDNEFIDELIVRRMSAHVRVDAVSQHDFWAGLTSDIAEGGIFIATHKLMPMGSVLTVHLELPDGEEPVAIRADVWWTRDYTGDRDVPPGLGLKFLSLDARTEARIRQFCERVREPMLYEA